MNRGHKATLKKKGVSGPAAGWDYNCRMGPFFVHFANSSFFPNKISIFSKKKEKKRKKRIYCGRPTGQETNFFLRVAQ